MMKKSEAYTIWANLQMASVFYTLHIRNIAELVEQNNNDPIYFPIDHASDCCALVSTIALMTMTEQSIERVILHYLCRIEITIKQFQIDEKQWPIEDGVKYNVKH